MNLKRMILLILTAIVVAGCSSPQGDTFDEKRAYALQMKKDALSELYQQKPITRDKIKNAAGYGVFSNININLLLLSSGNGYGVVHDNATGKDIYMNMRMLGVGLGIGAKDFKAIIIFRNADILDKFVTEGWEWGGHADAAAKSGEKGGSADAVGTLAQDMEIYQFTESGIALQATLAGTKYWKDKDLN